MSDGAGFGDALRKARIEAGYPTQLSAAKALGMEPPNYHRLERRETWPTGQTFKRLIETLGLDLTCFFPADAAKRTAKTPKERKRS